MAPENINARHVLVVGSGTLGRLVALVWASKAFNVTIVDNDPEAASSALQWIKKELPEQSKAVNGIPGEVTSVTDINKAVSGAWMAVECIPEIKEAKVDLLGQLDKICDKDAIIAVISSSFKSGELISKVSDTGRSRVLNTHYFQPPKLPAVEVMSSGYTEPTIIELLVTKLRELGLEPFVAKTQSTGLIYNRIWAAMKREVMMVLADKVGTPHDIDKLFRYSFQSKEAPCELMDKVGLQTVCNIEDHYIEDRGNVPRYPVDYIRKEYVEKGHTGVPTGQGLFDYHDNREGGSNKPSLRSQLIGAWELVDYSAWREDGSDIVHPLGRDAKGIIMYTPDGYMSAQLQRQGQPPFKSNDVNNGTAEEWKQAGENYLAYTGPYYLDESLKEPLLQHHMTNCSFPNWIGNTQRRLVKMSEEGGEKYLTLGNEAAIMMLGAKRLAQLKWRRLEDNHATPPHVSG